MFVISALLGGKLFPVMVGNLVESWPIMLHYLCLAITCGCGIIFSAANIIYRSIRGSTRDNHGVFRFSGVESQGAPHTYGLDLGT